MTSDKWKSGKRKKSLNSLVSLMVRKVVGAGTKLGASDEDNDYVFDISLGNNSTILAASISNNLIKLYDPMLEKAMAELKGHKKTITSHGFLKQDDPNMLISSSSDGTVRLWDTRKEGSQVGLFEAGKKEEFWSVDLGGATSHMLAAGSNDKIVVWDIRKQNKPQFLEDSHTEPVTQVKFHPEDPTRLFSASVDGLVCIFDTKMSFEDEDILQSVLSVDTSVSKIGFFGPQNSKLWCTTDIHTLSFWDVTECEKIAEINDLRESLTKKWTQEVSYVVQCVYDEGRDALFAVAGSNGGDLAFFPASVSKKEDSKILVKSAAMDLSSGHSSVVRSVLMPGKVPEGVACWSCGEDGRIVCWERREEVAMADEEGEGDRKMKRKASGKF